MPIPKRTIIKENSITIVETEKLNDLLNRGDTIMNDAFENCHEPKEYIELMYENTNKNTGELVFHGLNHDYDTGEEMYRFHMNWNEKDVEELIRDHKSLTESLRKIAEIEPEPEDSDDSALVKEKHLLDIWNIYLRGFTGDGEYTDEIAGILDKVDDIRIADNIRKKMDSKAELTKDEKELFEELKDITLTDAENCILDRYWDARLFEAEKRIGKSPFAYNVLILAIRHYKLIRLGAPQILVTNESRELLAAMALHRYCDRMNEI